MSLSNCIKLALLFAALLALIWVAPSHTSWRDSGEFLLGAAYLDILHPAGFPTYSQIANLFSLIPLGPLVWRIHLFSVVLAIVLLLTTYLLSRQLIKSYFEYSESTVTILSLIPLILLIASEPFIKGALSAEAYLFNAIFCNILLLLLLKYKSTKDLRLLTSAVFLTGVAAGNHIVFGMIALSTIPAWLLISQRPVRAIPACALALFVGLSVYGLLPIRAPQALPLNTGNPFNLNNFITQVTNARDAALRPKISGDDLIKSNFAQRLGNDLKKASNIISFPAAIFALLGLLLLARKSLPIALGILGISLSTLCFFSGWDADPWISLIVMLIVLTSVGIAFLPKYIPKNYQLLFAVGLGIVIVFIPKWGKNLELTYALAKSELPNQLVERSIENTEYRSALLVEPTWFILRSLNLLEGYRDDLISIYVPSLLFPSYFNPIRLTAPDAQSFDSSSIKNEDYYSPNEPMLRNIGRVINLFKSSAKIFLEPNSNLAEVLKGILNLRTDGSLAIIYKKNFSKEENYIASRINFYSSSLALANKLPVELRADNMNYLESLATHETELLHTIEGKYDLRLLSALCLNQDQSPCSSGTILNLAKLLANEGDYCQSNQLLEDLSSNRKKQFSEALLNLQKAAAIECHKK